MIGKLRHRLILQEPVLVEDDAGGKSRSFQELAKVWADVRDLSGNEGAYADGPSATTKTQVLLRYRADITTEMRFLYGQRILNIVAVLDRRGTKQFLTCMCENG